MFGLPGPGNGGKATLGWHHFPLALSGSLFFIRPPPVEYRFTPDRGTLFDLVFAAAKKKKKFLTVAER